MHFARWMMIIYQVYPRSFCDSNDDGIGDLAGIEQKLAYIKSLGVDAIWVSPFFKSPMKDFGYDVADYRAVDPIFGSMADFKSLMKSAKANGLGVMVDMVISHTSEEHAWFKQSRARQNDKSDWYLWADPQPDGSPPNNWVSVFGGPAWRWDAERRQYYFHSFLSSQPDLNMHHAGVQDAVLAEMDFWLDLGVSGFRFDACNHIFQDLELRNNPPREDTSKALHPYGFQIHVYDQARPEMGAFLGRIRKLLDAYGAFSLAEVGGHDALKLMGQYTQPGRLHSAYSFALMQPDCSAAHVGNVITPWKKMSRRRVWLATPRAIMTSRAWRAAGNTAVTATNMRKPCWHCCLQCVAISASIRVKNWACRKPTSPSKNCRIPSAFHSGQNSRVATVVAHPCHGQMALTVASAIPNPGCRSTRSISA